MRNRGWLAAGGVCMTIGIWLAPQSVEAAEAAGARGFIEEVVVTARRREETAQEVPIPISALSSQDLKDRGADDMRDLTRITPNLSFNNSGSAKNTAQIFMRGIGQVNWAPTQDPKIGTYVDGVYLGRPQGGVFDFLDVERVEVLRGPQGTLFGRNTTAGLIHVLSNRPTNEFEFSVGGGFGVDGILRGDAVINVPVSDTFAMRLAVGHKESDGYVKNTGSGDDWNDEDSQSARLSFRWLPTDAIRADLILDAQRVRELPQLGSCEWGEPDNGAESAAFLPSIAFIFGVYDEIRDACNGSRPFRSNENDPADSEVDAYSATLDLEVDLGFATLNSITSYRDISDFNSSWGWASDTAGTASFLEVIDVNDNDSDQWSQELRLSGTGLNDQLDWVFGLYAFEEEAVNDLDVPLFRGVAAPDCADWPIFCFPGPIPGLTLGDFAQAIQVGGSRFQSVEAKNSSQAVFGEVTWRFAEDWAVTAGARYTEDTREFTRTEILLIGVPDAALACPAGTPPPRNGTTCEVDRDFTEVTPRIIFSYNVNDDVMVYAGWSKGYSSGGFNQDVRMRPFKPEISGNWEAGVKSLLLDKRLMLNLTAFHNTYEEQQITVGRLVDGNPTADLINAQEATLYGFEGELRAELPANWYVQGSFGWIDGEYDEFTVEDNVIGGPPDFIESVEIRDLSDTKMIRGAKYTYSVAVGKNTVFDNGSSLNGQIGWAFRSRTYNTLEAHDSSRQGKYGLLDASFVWTLPNGETSISLFGTNLLDRQYYPTAIDLTNGVSRSGTNTKYWAEPRRYGIEFTHRFAGN